MIRTCLVTGLGFAEIVSVAKFWDKVKGLGVEAPIMKELDVE